MCNHHNIDWKKWETSLETPYFIKRIGVCADCGKEIEEVWKREGRREKGTDEPLEEYPV